MCKSCDVGILIFGATICFALFYVYKVTNPEKHALVLPGVPRTTGGGDSHSSGARHPVMVGRSDFRFYAYTEFGKTTCIDQLIDVAKKHKMAWVMQENSDSNRFVDAFISRYIGSHPLATSDPNNASMFVIPAIYFAWSKMPHFAFCRERVEEMISNSMFARRYHGMDHFVVATRAEASQISGWENVGSIVVEPYLEYGDCLSKNVRKMKLSTAWRRLVQTRPIVVPYWDNPPGVFEFDAERAASVAQRPMLATFFGMTKRAEDLRAHICRKMQAIARMSCSAPMDESVARGTIRTDIFDHLTRSRFCIVPRGSSDARRGLGTSILAGCIPVIFSDYLVAPFEEFLDYREFSVWFPEHDVDRGLEYLPTIPDADVNRMLRAVSRVRPHFLYDDRKPEYAVQPGGPIDMMVNALAMRANSLHAYRPFMDRLLEFGLREFECRQHWGCPYNKPENSTEA